MYVIGFFKTTANVIGLRPFHLFSTTTLLQVNNSIKGGKLTETKEAGGEDGSKEPHNEGKILY
jgi:hypothetical protein